MFVCSLLYHSMMNIACLSITFSWFVYMKVTVMALHKVRACNVYKICVAYTLHLNSICHSAETPISAVSYLQLILDCHLLRTNLRHGWRCYRVGERCGRIICLRLMRPLSLSLSLSLCVCVYRGLICTITESELRTGSNRGAKIS